MSTKVADSAVSELGTFFLTRDAWQPWQPTITQLASGIGRTINYARYAILAQTVIIQVRMTLTGTGTANNAIIITNQPTVIQPANVGIAATIGVATIFDSGVGYYAGSLLAIGAADFRIVAHGQANYVGITPNFGLAANDIISFQAVYERA